MQSNIPKLRSREEFRAMLLADPNINDSRFILQQILKCRDPEVDSLVECLDQLCTEGKLKKELLQEVFQTVINIFARKGIFRCVELAFKYGATINEETVYLAALANRLDIMRLIHSNNFDIHTPRIEKEMPTLLHLVNVITLEMTQFLVDKEPDINAVGIYSSEQPGEVGEIIHETPLSLVLDDIKARADQRNFENMPRALDVSILLLENGATLNCVKHLEKVKTILQQMHNTSLSGKAHYLLGLLLEKELMEKPIHLEKELKEKPMHYWEEAAKNNYFPAFLKVLHHYFQVEEYMSAYKWLTDTKHKSYFNQLSYNEVIKIAYEFTFVKEENFPHELSSQLIDPYLKKNGSIESVSPENYLLLAHVINSPRISLDYSFRAYNHAKAELNRALQVQKQEKEKQAFERIAEIKASEAQSEAKVERGIAIEKQNLAHTEENFEEEKSQRFIALDCKFRINFENKKEQFSIARQARHKFKEERGVANESKQREFLSSAKSDILHWAMLYINQQISAENPLTSESKTNSIKGIELAVSNNSKSRDSSADFIFDFLVTVVNSHMSAGHIERAMDWLEIAVNLPDIIDYLSRTGSNKEVGTFITHFMSNKHLIKLYNKDLLANLITLLPPTLVLDSQDSSLPLDEEKKRTPIILPPTAPIVKESVLSDDIAEIFTPIWTACTLDSKALPTSSTLFSSTAESILKPRLEKLQKTIQEAKIRGIVSEDLLQQVETSLSAINHMITIGQLDKQNVLVEDCLKRLHTIQDKLSPNVGHSLVTQKTGSSI